MAETAARLPAEKNWTLVVAVARNGVIGRGDTLPWKLRSDLKRFKQMTLGNCLLMGRKTYESIGRPLPGRQTIVLSRQDREKRPAPFYVGELADVPQCVEQGRKVMVVGGAEVYRAAIDFCSTIWLTRVLADVEGDTFFPELDWSQWKLLSNTAFAAGPHDQWPTEFQIWTRRVTP